MITNYQHMEHEQSLLLKVYPEHFKQKGDL